MKQKMDELSEIPSEEDCSLAHRVPRLLVPDHLYLVPLPTTTVPNTCNEEHEEKAQLPYSD